jgi:type 1 fimbria pilin
MNFDIKNNVDVVQSIAPQQLSGTVTGTSTAAGVDLRGYNSAMAVINCGAAGGTAPSFTFQVEESDDNSTFTAVASADLSGTEPSVGTANDNAVYRIGYKGGSRYIRVSVPATSGTTPTLFAGASIVRGRPDDAPV